MLRIPAALAVLGLTAVTLVACSSAPASSSASSSCERVDSDTTVLDLIETDGEFGKPSMTVQPPLYVDETVHADEKVGTGTRVTSEQQDVAFTVTVARGATGETITTETLAPQTIAKWRNNLPGFADMMMCATEGSRIVGAVPASTGMSPNQAQNLGIGDGEALAVTLDLTKVYLPAADGAPQYNDRRGMPSVVLAPGGRPGLVIPSGSAPDQRVVETLKKGDGAVVDDIAAARVHVLAVEWDSKTVTESTWEDGASRTVTSGDVFADAVQGATVGSQLMVVDPGAPADGQRATVYVVDILGIDDPAPAAATR